MYLLRDFQVDFYWQEIIEGLKAVPRYFEYYSEEWTYEQVKRGHLAVWALSDGVIRGIVLSRVLEYPKQKEFAILAIYGLDMLDFFELMSDVFMNVARKLGCKTISASCRPGLKRLLKPFGAEAESYHMYRAVPQIGDQ